MYRIGEFSKMSKTTVKTLRYYDEVGLLKPKRVDDFTGYRFYTTDQLVRLHHIQALRQIGLSIDEIRLIMSGRDASAIMQRRKRELESDIARCTEQLSRIEFMLSGKEELSSMQYQAVLKEIPECIVYSKKITVPNYGAYFTVIPAIGQEVMDAYPDLKCVVPEYCFIVYLDDEYKESDINVEFCEAVDKMCEDFDDIKFKNIDAATVVSVMHKGPYAGLKQAYAYAFNWIEENGYIVV
ncbi:MAG: MerR family transcriptional regulator, partial [Actinobacteria bacterium]|nr:MerR family transcriptional regulator [Actinomycetota bacterium]